MTSLAQSRVDSLLRQRVQRRVSKRQWTRYYDDRRSAVVYRLYWQAPNGVWYSRERIFARFAVRTEPNIRTLIAASLRQMRATLSTATKGASK